MKGAFNEECSQGFRHVNVWSTVVMLLLEAEEVQCAGGSKSLGTGLRVYRQAPLPLASLVALSLSQRCDLSASQFLRSCFPAKTDTYASGTVSQNKFSPHSCFWSFSFFLTTTEKKQIKRRNLCTDISSESCLLVLAEAGENRKNWLRPARESSGLFFCATQRKLACYIMDSSMPSKAMSSC